MRKKILITCSVALALIVIYGIINFFTKADDDDEQVNSGQISE